MNIIVDPKEFLTRLFQEAIKAALPGDYLRAQLPKTPPKGRTIIVGAGKASALMAKVVEEALPWPVEGVVVTRYGHDVACNQIEIIQASHPVPDKHGEKAAARILNLVEKATKDDLILGLWSGGGSSLLSLPEDGITLEDKISLNQQLLKSGANIEEINIIRKSLSKIKGGKLSKAAYPAQVMSYIISDVAGDNLSTVASGPTCQNFTTRADALRLLHHYDVNIPKNVEEFLRQDSLSIASKYFNTTTNMCIATPLMSLEAAAQFAKNIDIDAEIIADDIEGDAGSIALMHASIARFRAKSLTRPLVLLSGGETSVVVRGKGRGGRNTEFLLYLLKALNGNSQIYALAGDTDGIDGVENSAGAIITPQMVHCSIKMNLDINKFLNDNNSYEFFEKMENLIITGPTFTNVNDFRAIYIAPCGK